MMHPGKQLNMDSLTEVPQSGSSVTFVPDERLIKRHIGRPSNQERLAAESFQTISLADQIKIESRWVKMLDKRMQAYNGTHQGFLDLAAQALDHSRHLDELRSKLKPRHPRSANGINIERIRRVERAEKLNRARAERSKDNGNGTREGGSLN